MKLRVLAIGKPKLSYAAAGTKEYGRRLKHYAEVEIEFLKDKQASQQLLDRSAGSYRIALDERGEQLTTAKLVTEMNQLEQRGDIKAVSFLIGGADGHDAEFREKCDRVWCLSELTMQHELALVVLLEQLYRVYTIKRGEPYHR